MNATSTQQFFIKAANVWDGESDGLCAGPQEILIRNGKIIEIGQHVDMPDGTQALEFGPEYTITPGFIDCHVHTTLLSAKDMTQRSVSEKSLLPLDALSTLLGNGFTTVRDVGCFDPYFITIGLRNLIEEGGIIGPRMLVAPHMLSARGGHGDLSSLVGSLFQPVEFEVADGVSAIIKAVREEVRKSADWIKFAATGGFGSPSSNPGQTTYSQEEMIALVSTASDLKIFTSTHAYGDEGVRRAVVAGVRSVEHASLISEDTLKMIVHLGIFVVPTQLAILLDAVNVNNDGHWEGRNPWERPKFKLYSQALLDAAGRLAGSDAKVAFGSDVGCFPFKDSRKEFWAMVTLGHFKELRALKAATSMAASLLDRSDLGVLAAGRKADIVAFEGNPLKHLSDVGRVRFIMKEGIIYAKSDTDAQYPGLIELMQGPHRKAVRIIPTPSAGWQDDLQRSGMDFELPRINRV